MSIQLLHRIPKSATVYSRSTILQQSSPNSPNRLASCRVSQVHNANKRRVLRSCEGSPKAKCRQYKTTSFAPTRFCVFLIGPTPVNRKKKKNDVLQTLFVFDKLVLDLFYKLAKLMFVSAICFDLHSVADGMLQHAAQRHVIVWWLFSVVRRKVEFCDELLAFRRTVVILQTPPLPSVPKQETLLTKTFSLITHKTRNRTVFFPVYKILGYFLLYKAKQSRS